MIAVTAVWRLHGVDGVLAAPAALDILRGVATEPRTLALQVMPPRVAGGRTACSRCCGSSRPCGVCRLPREAAPIRRSQSCPAIPAGRYRLRVEGGGPGGWLMLGIGQDQFALRSEALDLAGSADRD